MATRPEFVGPETVRTNPFVQTNIPHSHYLTKKHLRQEQDGHRYTRLTTGGKKIYLSLDWVNQNNRKVTTSRAEMCEGWHRYKRLAVFWQKVDQVSTQDHARHMNQARRTLLNEFLHAAQWRFSVVDSFLTYMYLEEQAVTEHALSLWCFQGDIEVLYASAAKDSLHRSKPNMTLALRLIEDSRHHLSLSFGSCMTCLLREMGPIDMTASPEADHRAIETAYYLWAADKKRRWTHLYGLFPRQQASSAYMERFCRGGSGMGGQEVVRQIAARATSMISLSSISNLSRASTLVERVKGARGDIE